MTKSDKILDHIIKQAKLDDDISIIWLYGSRAKGTAKQDSDFDIAIAFNNFTLSQFDKAIRPQEYALQWNSELNSPEKTISVVDINTIPSYLAVNVVEYGNVLLNKNISREMKETQRIYSQFEYEMITHSKWDNGK
jgi:predicted nucleotidyltransferase